MNEPASQKQEERQNVTDFPKPRLIIGGGDPPDMNWLMSLKKGTVFAARTIRDPETNRPSNNFLLLTCQVINKSISTVILVENLHDKMLGRVDPVRFTNQYALAEILWEPEEGKTWPADYEEQEFLKKQEDENGQRDRVQGNTEGTDGPVGHDSEPTKVD